MAELLHSLLLRGYKSLVAIKLKQILRIRTIYNYMP